MRRRRVQQAAVVGQELVGADVQRRRMDRIERPDLVPGERGGVPEQAIAYVDAEAGFQQPWVSCWTSSEGLAVLVARVTSTRAMRLVTRATSSVK